MQQVAHRDWVTPSKKVIKTMKTNKLTFLCSSFTCCDQSVASMYPYPYTLAMRSVRCEDTNPIPRFFPTCFGHWHTHRPQALLHLHWEKKQTVSVSVSILEHVAHSQSTKQILKINCIKTFRQRSKKCILEFSWLFIMQHSYYNDFELNLSMQFKHFNIQTYVCHFMGTIPRTRVSLH